MAFIIHVLEVKYFIIIPSMRFTRKYEINAHIFLNSQATTLYVGAGGVPYTLSFPTSLLSLMFSSSPKAIFRFIPMPPHSYIHLKGARKKRVHHRRRSVCGVVYFNCVGEAA